MKLNKTWKEGHVWTLSGSLNTAEAAQRELTGVRSYANDISCQGLTKGLVRFVAMWITSCCIHSSFIIPAISLLTFVTSSSASSSEKCRHKSLSSLWNMSMTATLLERVEAQVTTLRPAKEETIARLCDIVYRRRTRQESTNDSKTYSELHQRCNSSKFLEDTFKTVHLCLNCPALHEHL